MYKRFILPLIIIILFGSQVGYSAGPSKCEPCGHDNCTCHNMFCHPIAGGCGVLCKASNCNCSLGGFCNLDFIVCECGGASCGCAQKCINPYMSHLSDPVPFECGWIHNGNNNNFKRGCGCTGSKCICCPGIRCGDCGGKNACRCWTSSTSNRLVDCQKCTHCKFFNNNNLTCGCLCGNYNCPGTLTINPGYANEGSGPCGCMTAGGLTTGGGGYACGGALNAPAATSCCGGCDGEGHMGIGCGATEGNGGVGTTACQPHCASVGCPCSLLTTQMHCNCPYLTGACRYSNCHSCSYKGVLVGPDGSSEYYRCPTEVDCKGTNAI